MENCEHKFQVIRVCDGEPLLQVLYCKRCKERYLGCDGMIGSPVLIHKIKKPIDVSGFTQLNFKDEPNEKR
jgi:hypothetical protein